METKVCSVCEIEKVKTEFYARPNRKCGVTSHCKECELKKKVIYHSKNKESQNSKNSKRYWANRDERLKSAKLHYKENSEIYKYKSKEYRNNNPEVIEKYLIKTKDRRNAHKRNRLRVDPQFRIASNTRGRIREGLKGNLKECHSEELVGCSWAEYTKYLESLWEPWMNWGNYGKYKRGGERKWNVDHIIPIDSFDMTNPAEHKKAFHYTNCRPMLVTDNCSKGAKLVWDKPVSQAIQHPNRELK